MVFQAANLRVSSSPSTVTWVAQTAVARDAVAAADPRLRLLDVPGACFWGQVSWLINPKNYKYPLVIYG